MKTLLRTHSLLLLILAVAFAVRLYRVQYPLLDWHSWRQADTASVTKEYVDTGIDLLHPRYHDLSDIPSGLDNSQEGYRMVEFPFINALSATILRQVDSLPLVPTSRVVSILFSLGTLIAIYFLSKEIAGQKTGYMSALTFAILPFSIYYSRAILPETPMLFFSTASILLFHYWLKSNDFKWYAGSSMLLMLALLLKPFVMFLAPVYACLLWYHRKLTIRRVPMLVVFGLLSVAPLLWWRQWIAQFPEGIPASDWLFNSNGIRFRPAWFRWLGYERLTKLILGFAGIAFVVLGLVTTKPFTDKRKLFYWSWWLSIFAYVAVLATGNVQHDYYQNLLLPIVCLTIGEGVTVLYRTIANLAKKYNYTKAAGHLFGIGTVVTLYLLMVLLSWQAVKGYFNINRWDQVKAGSVANELLPPEAKVIAPNGGDTAFLFQTRRKGWPIGYNIDKKIEQGATHYLTTSFDDEAAELESKYFIVAKTDDYLLLDLTKTKEQP